MSTFGTRRKLMSISRGEFEASVRALDAGAAMLTDGLDVVARFALADSGTAIVRYEPLAARTIGGGLLSLPQAHVTISFEQVSEAAERTFIARFEISFQRGGG